MSAPQPAEITNCAAMAWAADVECGGTSARAVLGVMAKNAAPDGSCPLTQPQIAAKAYLSARQIVRVLAGLVDMGLISRQRHGGGGRGRLPDTFVLSWHHANQAPCQTEHYAKLAYGTLPNPPPEKPTRTTTVSIRHDAKTVQIPQEIDSSLRDNLPKKDISLSSKLKADADEASAGLWAIWPAKARKRWTQAAVREAVIAQLKTGATPAELLAAGKAHVRERCADGDGFVKGLVLFLRGGLWRNWAEQGAAPGGKRALSEQHYRVLCRAYLDGGWPNDVDRSEIWNAPPAMLAEFGIERLVAKTADADLFAGI